MADKKYTDILLEDIDNKITRMAEAMTDVPGTVVSLDERLNRVEEELKVIRVVVTSHATDIKEQAGKITKLKQKLA